MSKKQRVGRVFEITGLAFAFVLAFIASTFLAIDGGGDLFCTVGFAFGYVASAISAVLMIIKSVKLSKLDKQAREGGEN